MDASVISAMAEIISHVKTRVALPHRVNMLLDPLASLALNAINPVRARQFVKALRHWQGMHRS